MATRSGWGQGTPPVESIVEAALRLLDEQGFAALTTRRLATAMGIHQPSIYRRVADREALLGLVADAIMAETGRIDQDGEDWRAWLRATGVRVRATWRRHPHAGPLLHHGGRHPAIAQFFDDVVAVMRTAGLVDKELLTALQAYLGYVFGTIMLESRDTPDATRAPARADERSSPDLWHLQQLLGHEVGNVGDRTFLAGLDLVLDGIANRAAPPHV